MFFQPFRNMIQPVKRCFPAFPGGKLKKNRTVVIKQKSQQPCGADPPYLFKMVLHGRFLPCLRHVVSALHIDKHFRINAQCRLENQCDVTRHRAFGIENLIQHGIGHTDFGRKVLLGNAPCFYFFFHHITGMCRKPVCGYVHDDIICNGLTTLLMCKW